MRQRVACRYAARLSPDLRHDIHRAAEEFDVPSELLTALILQEMQFYHGTRLQSFWSAVFLVCQALPFRALAHKSMGVASIKPLTAARLMRSVFDIEVTSRAAAALVSWDQRLAIRLAAAELARFRQRGATDTVAFLAYAAHPSTVEDLLRNEGGVLAHSASFRRRLADYRVYLDIARSLSRGQ